MYLLNLYMYLFHINKHKKNLKHCIIFLNLSCKHWKLNIFEHFFFYFWPLTVPIRYIQFSLTKIDCINVLHTLMYFGFNTKKQLFREEWVLRGKWEIRPKRQRGQKFKDRQVYLFILDSKPLTRSVFNKFMKWLGKITSNAVMVRFNNLSGQNT